MSKDSSSNPPIWAEEYKFDGTNFVGFKNRILVTTRLRGALGYLEGNITKPSPPPATTLPPEPTEWESRTPSIDEWNKRDAWVLALIVYNSKNPMGYGIKQDGTAAEAWKSLTDIYGQVDANASALAERTLRNTKLSDNGDFAEHITLLRTRWTMAVEKGAQVDDKAFQAIVLASLPKDWNIIVSILYSAKTSADAIATLTLHWERLKEQNTSSAPSATALQIKTSKKSSNSDLKCVNTNCGRTGHTIENCYWKGGGKEGQFPPHFRNRGRTSPAENTSTPAKSNTPAATANIADATPSPTTDRSNSSRVTYALMATIANEDLPAYNLSPVEAQFAPRAILEGHPDATETYFTDFAQTKAMVASRRKLTYADSGASDHCFIERSDFTDYVKFDPPRRGQSANEGGNFRILGKGTVKKYVVVDGHETELIFSNALHTPDLSANLISIAKFDNAGFSVHFSGGKAAFYSPDGRVFMLGTGTSGLYLLETSSAIPPNLEANFISTERAHEAARIAAETGTPPT